MERENSCWEDKLSEFNGDQSSQTMATVGEESHGLAPGNVRGLAETWVHVLEHPVLHPTRQDPLSSTAKMD
jgi:hypothetical protein